MTSLFDLSQNMQKLSKEGKYKDILNSFKENKSNFTVEQIKGNSFVVYYIVLALIELGYYEEVFSFLKSYNISSLDPKSFAFLLSKLKDKTTLNQEFVSKFCDLVNPDLLDESCVTIEIDRKWVKKPMELASAKENRYAVKTKALAELQQYEKCFELSKKALSIFHKFHYSNDVWFARRIALSKIGLWKPEESLQELLSIVQKKKEWFIQSEIAELYKSFWDIENSFKFAIDAINNFWDIEFKVNLLVLLWDILQQRGENDLAFKHYLLSKLLRQKSEWNVPTSLENLLKTFSNPQLSLDQIGQLISELKKYRNGFKSDDHTKEYSGVVEKILNDNENGINWFITYDTSKKVYFNEKFPNKFGSKLIVGTKLRFKIKTMPDGKEKAIIL